MPGLKGQMAKQLGEAQSRYTYFLLAIAASAIAFAVQKTTGRTLDRSMVLLGFAVLSWGGSFFAGCRNRAYFSSALYANIALLQLEDGTHPKLPPHPDLLEAAYEGVRNALENNSSAAGFWGRLQFRLLVLGAIFFLSWHIFEMASLNKLAEPVFQTSLLTLTLK
ncbi:MAG: hypothetical protein NTY36_05025 [Deltaproteobacteria bacterium]|nr:hypothetical protein [Deltaproteobacteria bacterium]